MIDMVRLVPGYSIDTESLLTYDEFEMGVRYITWATSSQTKGLAEMAIFQYTDWKDKTNPAKLRDAVNDVYGDYILKCPTIDIVNAYSKAGLDTYYYDLRRRSSGSPWPGWMGVVHGDEIQYIFGHPLNTEFGPYSDEDVDLSLQMMHYWANFAKYGNPNPLTSNIWPRYTKDERRYFVINGALEGAPNIEDYPRTPYCEFWNNLVPQLEMGPQHYIPLMTVNKTQATTAVPTDEREVESKTSPTIATRAAPVRCQVSSSSASMSARYLTNRRVVASFAVGALLLHYLLVFWD
ncbi:cholinesterase-like [Saccoglossus kowalevskii]